MRKILHCLISLLLIPVIAPSSFAQDISDLIPFANYTLINTDEDALGLQEPIELEHAPFSGANGVYSNGLYIGANPDDGSYIHTPFMSALYDSVFAIELEFNLEELSGSTKPIMVCGGGYRYLGFTVRYDSLFQIYYNNGNLIPIIGAVAQTAKWYKLTILHHENNSLNEFYLDGILLTQFYAELDRPANDGNIMNINPSNGTAFKGYWRNLRIYGTEDISSIQDFPTENQVILFPNPARSSLQFAPSIPNATHWSITGIDGAVMMKGKVSEASHEIDLHALVPGGYIFLVQASTGIILAQKTFVKN